MADQLKDMFDTFVNDLGKNQPSGFGGVFVQKIYLTLQEACEGTKKEASIGVIPPGNAINSIVRVNMRNAAICVSVPPNTHTGDMLHFAFMQPEDAQYTIPEGTKFIAEVVTYPYEVTTQPMSDLTGANFTKPPVWNERIRISIEEARSGCKKKIQFYIPVTCTRCNGRGYLESEHRCCDTCNGSGFMRGNKTQACKLKIPALSDEQRGTGFYMKGKGAQLPKGGRGDLFVAIDF